jgi:hypothetical protein
VAARLQRNDPESSWQASRGSSLEAAELSRSVLIPLGSYVLVMVICIASSSGNAIGCKGAKFLAGAMKTWACKLTAVDLESECFRLLVGGLDKSSAPAVCHR